MKSVQQFSPKVLSPPRKRPLLIFDGTCGFCRYWVERWKHLTGNRVDYSASQDVAHRFPEILPSQFDTAVVFVELDGSVTTAARAVLSAYAYAPFGAWPRQLYGTVPGFAWLCEATYRFVASNRMAFSKITRWLWGSVPESSSYNMSRACFLRGLGVVYLIAFASLWVQIDGLIGNNGILPADQFTDHVRAAAHDRGLVPYELAPTFSLYLKGDWGLHVQCAFGTFLSLLLITGVAPGIMLVLLWLVYLSLTIVGQTFLGFQWENLLLEAGFLAIFLAPMQLVISSSPRTPPHSAFPRLLWLGVEAIPRTLGRLLLWWLLFRLMLQSGLVKLLSNDDAWWELDALNYHYWTQPLPVWISFYVHHFPHWIHKVSVLATYVIEIVFPFFIIFPRRPRLLAFWAFALLMTVIALTGNYTYFNFLTIVIALLLVADQNLPRCVRESMRRRTRPHWLNSGFGGLQPFAAVSAVIIVSAFAWLTWIILPVSWHHLHRTIHAFSQAASNRLNRELTISEPNMSERLRKKFQRVSPYHSINSYGLFADMTEKRPEIIIEGSDDLRTWRAYEFKYKPGALNRRPRFVQPHQPRLDWQMWFAALRSYQGSPWFLSLAKRLLEGQPEVLALLAENPFPERPPHYLRATTYDYHFTTPAELRETGNWWKRDNPRAYIPMVTLQNGQLARIETE